MIPERAYGDGKASMLAKAQRAKPNSNDGNAQPQRTKPNLSRQITTANAKLQRQSDPTLTLPLKRGGDP